MKFQQCCPAERAPPDFDLRHSRGSLGPALVMLPWDTAVPLPSPTPWGSWLGQLSPPPPVGVPREQQGARLPGPLCGPPAPRGLRSPGPSLRILSPCGPRAPDLPVDRRTAHGPCAPTSPRTPEPSQTARPLPPHGPPRPSRPRARVSPGAPPPRRPHLPAPPAQPKPSTRPDAQPPVGLSAAETRPQPTRPSAGPAAGPRRWRLLGPGPAHAPSGPRAPHTRVTATLKGAATGGRRCATRKVAAALRDGASCVPAPWARPQPFYVADTSPLPPAAPPAYAMTQTRRAESPRPLGLSPAGSRRAREAAASGSAAGVRRAQPRTSGSWRVPRPAGRAGPRSHSPEPYSDPDADGER